MRPVFAGPAPLDLAAALNLAGRIYGDDLDAWRLAEKLKLIHGVVLELAEKKRGR